MTNTELAPVAGETALTHPATPKPKGTFLSRLSVSQKLLLSSALLGLPLLGVSAGLGNLYYQDFKLAQRQTAATMPFTSMKALQMALRTMRGYDSAHVPKTVIADTRKQAAALLDAAKATGIPAVIESAKTIQAKTTSLTAQLEGSNLTSEEILEVTSDVLSADLQPLFITLSNSGALLNTTDSKARELARMSSETLPTLLPKIGALFGNLIVELQAARSQSGGKLSEAQRGGLALRFTEADALSQELSRTFETLTTDNPDLKGVLGPAYEAALNDTNAAFRIARSGSLDTGKVAVSQQQLFDASDAYLASQYAAFDKTIAAMRQTFEQQQAGARQRLMLLLAALLGLITIAALLLSRVIGNITRPLSELTLASEKLATGDLDVRVPVQSEDELGQLSKSFNSAAAQLRQNARRVEAERVEAQKLQYNVGEFLDVTMDIAEGDLTKRGKVTQDVLGNVVDSINLMVEELAETLRGVQQASQSVTQGSATMLGTTDQIAQGASITATQTRLVAAQANDLNARIQAMASIAQASAEKARQALEASQEGERAVSTTLSGMTELRQASQDTAQRVQSLAGRSEEIQVIVDSIGHIASQTNLLSLHASIEAAGAGEAGSRFAIVAEEVRQLADESSAAASRVATLLTAIQQEIRAVAQSMQENTAQVEQGYQVAGQAGERLRQIGSLSEQSAQLAHDISAATTEQVTGVKQMGQSVQEIAQIAQAAQQSVREGRSAAEQLQGLAQQLDQSLRRFRLPS